MLTNGISAYYRHVTTPNTALAFWRTIREINPAPVAFPRRAPVLGRWRSRTASRLIRPRPRKRLYSLPMLRQLLLSIHLLGAITWLGGMFFAYFALRPAAAEVLAPPQRLPLWAAVFARFLPSMAVAIALLLATGLAMFLPVGFRYAPAGWHVMLGLGLAMAAVFLVVYRVLFPRLRRQCAESSWPAAAATLNRIRQLVAVNLGLGVAVVLAAASAR